MSTTYGLQTQSNETSWIVSPGQLVRIKRDCFEQIGVIGIIIKCDIPDFSYTGADQYSVWVDGQLQLIDSFMIWPV